MVVSGDDRQVLPVEALVVSATLRDGIQVVASIKSILGRWASPFRPMEDNMKMNRMMVAGLLLAVTSGSAFATTYTTSSGYYDYRGAFIVTGIAPRADGASTAQSCANAGITVGSHYNFRFTPPSLGSNNSSWHFTVIGLSYAENYYFNSAPAVGAAIANVNGAEIIGRGYNSFAVLPSLKVSSQYPSTVDTTTLAVIFEGKVNNFQNYETSDTTTNTGCSVFFRASGVLEP